MAAACLVLSMVLGAQVAQAKVWQVTSTADPNPPVPFTSTGCTLREAILSAGNGDTIRVPAGHYTLSAPLKGLGPCAPSSPAPPCSPSPTPVSITIVGAGADKVIIDGGQATQDFYVPGGDTVSLSGVTLTRGLWDGDGAGIGVDGTLNLSHSRVTNNTSFATGGGIYSDGTLSVSDTTISGNQGDEAGGGLGNSGVMTLTSTTITGNQTSFTGGGIAEFGGAADVISNSTITGNESTALSSGDQGGGIYDDNLGQGLTGTNDTIAGNSALQGGNVFFNDISRGGFENTIIAMPAGGAQNCDTSGLEPPSLGHNLEDDATASCGLTDPTDQVGVKAKLRPLADNGGPTKTMALKGGSPAIDAGATIKAIKTDQRGAPRPQPAGGNPDIGAYEYAALVDMGIHLSAAQPATVGHALTYVIKVTNTGPSPDTAWGVQVSDLLPSGVKFVSATTSKEGNCQLVAGHVSCALGPVPGSENVRVTVIPKKPGFPVDKSAVFSDGLDPKSSNNQDRLTVRVQGRPDASTGGIDSLAYRGATAHATVNPNNARTTYYFEYGRTTSYGSKTVSLLASGLSPRGVLAALHGLHPGRLYHYRIVALNAVGKSTGSDHTFFTYYLPVLHVSPARIRPGRRLRVYGNAGKCPVGETVTLLSPAFARRHTYRGQGVIYTRVRHHGFFSTTTQIPSNRHRGTYPVSGLCGRFSAGAAGDPGVAARAGGRTGGMAIGTGRLTLG